MKTELSARELAVLTLAVQGFTDDMIAKELGIETGTVNSYWVRIRGKMGALSRTELVARFVQANADTRLAEDKKRAQVEADALELTNKDILDKANAEIDRLRELIKDREK